MNQNNVPPQYVRPHVWVLARPRSPGPGRPWCIDAVQRSHTRVTDSAPARARTMGSRYVESPSCIHR